MNRWLKHHFADKRAPAVGRHRLMFMIVGAQLLNNAKAALADQQRLATAARGASSAVEARRTSCRRTLHCSRRRRRAGRPPSAPTMTCKGDDARQYAQDIAPSPWAAGAMAARQTFNLQVPGSSPGRPTDRPLARRSPPASKCCVAGSLEVHWLSQHFVGTAAPLRRESMRVRWAAVSSDELSHSCAHCGFEPFTPMWEFESSVIGLCDDDRYPGRCLLVLRTHHEHLEEVPLPLMASFAAEVQTAGRAVRDVPTPAASTTPRSATRMRTCT